MARSGPAGHSPVISGNTMATVWVLHPGFLLSCRRRPNDRPRTPALRPEAKLPTIPHRRFSTSSTPETLERPPLHAYHVIPRDLDCAGGRGRWPAIQEHMFREPCVFINLLPKRWMYNRIIRKRMVPNNRRRIAFGNSRQRRSLVPCCMSKAPIMKRPGPCTSH